MGMTARELILQMHRAEPVLSSTQDGDPNGLRLPGDGLDWRAKIREVVLNDRTEREYQLEITTAVRILQELEKVLKARTELLQAVRQRILDLRDCSLDGQPERMRLLLVEVLRLIDAQLFTDPPEDRF